MGYGASECKLNIPNELANASGIAAPFACFFEFAAFPAPLATVSQKNHHGECLQSFAALQLQSYPKYRSSPLYVGSSRWRLL